MSAGIFKKKKERKKQVVKGESAELENSSEGASVIKVIIMRGGLSWSTDFAFLVFFFFCLTRALASLQPSPGSTPGPFFAVISQTVLL